MSHGHIGNSRNNQRLYSNNSDLGPHNMLLGAG